MKRKNDRSQHPEDSVFHRSSFTFHPVLALLLWVLPIVLVRSTDQSLMAHDEGIYATQARSILQTGDWITPQWGGNFVFDRTIGIQWLIAGCYLLFGISEGTARLPSAISFVLSVLLTYAIGRRMTNSPIAWIGAAIFAVIPLVTQYGRLATQDSVLVCVELLIIWSLLKAESSARWAFLAGSLFGVGFMIKGFMIIPATIALFPYLIAQHRRHRHLLNGWLYLGFVSGMMIPIAWLWAATQKYGSAPVQQLFAKFFHLGGQTYLGAGPFYYYWNIPANGFPWVFFALGGLWLAFRHAPTRDLLKSTKTRFLIIGYPIALFVQLTLFGTKTHYYPLQLMPFIGLFAAIALVHLAKLFAARKRTRLLIGLNLVVGGFAMLLLIIVAKRVQFAQTFSLDWRGDRLDQVALVMLTIGLGWLSLSVIWMLRDQSLQHSAKYWMVGWLLTSWLAMAMLNLTGLWGNYESELKVFLQQTNVQEILRSQPVSFVVNEAQIGRGDRKTHLLLNFYTPQTGQQFKDLKILPKTDFAWIDPIFAKSPNLKYELVDTYEGWVLGKRWQRSG